MLSPVVQSLSSMTETSHLRDSSSSSKSGDYLSKYLHMHTQTQTPHTACIQPGTVLAQMSANQNYAIPLSCATMQLQPKGILHSRQEEFFRPSHQDHISEPCLITFNMFHKYVYTWAKTGKKRGINTSVCSYLSLLQEKFHFSISPAVKAEKELGIISMSS